MGVGFILPIEEPLVAEGEGQCAPLKWSHHQPKAHTLPMNKVKALNLMNKTKGKIILKTVLTHQVMPKVKFSPPSKFKIKNKLKTALKMIK